jgi:5'-nucleotidase
MRILVDMDSIAVNLMAKWYRTYNEEWGDDLGVERVLSWNVHEHVKPECGLKVYEIIERPGFFRDLEPIPGAVDGVTALVQDGHQVAFATSAAGADSARDKVAWVEEHFAHLKWGVRNIVLLHDKAEWLDADLLIDDRPDTIEAWVRAGRRAMTILYPYNRHVADLCCAAVLPGPEAWGTLVESVRAISIDLGTQTR